MSRIITAALIAATALLMPALPASAATNPACMSHKEFRAIHNGMSLTRVAGIVGSKGKLTSSSRIAGYTTTMREHHTCGSRFGSALTMYQNGKLISKTALWI